MSDPATLSGRLTRLAKVGVNLGGFAAGMAATRVAGRPLDDRRNAEELRRVLGALKGPVMKIAQVLGNIPDAVPPEYAAELAKLQADAPPMGPAFVRRRMAGELGPDWQRHFAEFPLEAAAAASLGQVHRARLATGEDVAVKLQYPDMGSAVEADLRQMDLLLALFRRIDRSIDASEIREEIANRLREELDYARELRHLALYRDILADRADVRVPRPYPALSTPRLLTMEWVPGDKLLAFRNAPLAVRNALARALFHAWYVPLYRYGIIHGDPHLGNYTVADAEAGVINLLDFGCVRIFPPHFLTGVNELFHAIETDDDDRAAHAFELWGFRNLTREIRQTILLWAKFLYGPLLDDRVRPIDLEGRPGEYGRATAARVHRELRRLGTVRIPAEFVFMDRAAVGLGGVFIQLGAELNWSAMFRALIEGFDEAALAARQAEALTAAGLASPSAGG